MDYSKYAKYFDDLDKPTQSSYPQILTDNRSNTCRTQVIPFTVEMMYDFLHHGHTPDAIVDMTATEPGPEEDPGDGDDSGTTTTTTDYGETIQAIINILMDIADVLEGMGADVTAIKQAIAELGGESSETEPGPQDEPDEVDKSELETILAEVAKLDKDDYTEDSWENLQTVADAATEIYYNDEATQEEVDQAVIDVQAAIDALEPAEEEPEPVDKTLLGTLIEYCDGLDSSEYTEDTWSELETVLTGARAIYEDEDASQEDVDAAAEELQAAIDALEAIVPVDKSSLGALIAEAKLLNEEDYTPSTWTAFYEMLENAEKAYDSDVVTQEEVTMVTEYLQSAMDALVKRADKTALTELLESVAEMDEEEYTPSTWSALQDTLVEVKVVAEDAEATQEAVDAAVDSLQTAINGLVKRADKTTLEALISEVNSLSEEAYTPTSWATLQEVLAEAQIVYSDAEATQDSVDSTCEQLQSAISALVERADTTALEALIAEANDLNADDYTPSTWAVFSDVLSSASELVDNVEASQEEVDQMVTTLQDAMSALVKRADKTALEQLIEQANALDSSEFTEDTWNVLKVALESATTIDEDLEASQEAVDEAVTALQEAIDGLKEYVDKTALGELLAQAKELSEDDYTPSTWSGFAEMLANAEKAYDSDAVTQEEVNMVVEYLQAAMDNLVKRADKTALEELIASIDELSEDEYTPSSWEALQNTLTEVKVSYEDAEATQEDVDAAVDALQNAIDNLTKRADKTTLKDLIDSVDNLDESEYTPSTWSALQTVLSEVEVVYNDAEASDEEVSAAIESLQTAIDGLVKLADKTALVELLESVAELDEEEYTPSTWSALQTAIVAADSVNSDVEASQEAVDEAVDALQTAINGLVKRADKTALEEVIAQADALESSEYTEDTWNNLQYVLGLAKEVYDDAEATQDDVDQSVDAVKEAIENLKEYVDKTALEALIAQAKELSEDDYTPSTWSAFKAMLDNADIAYASETISQEEVNMMVEYLQASMDALVKRADKTALKDLIDSIDDLDESEYTADSWAVLKTALEDATTVYDDLEASQETVDETVGELQTAIDSLVKADYHASVVDEDGNVVECETLEEAVEKVANGGTITVLEDTVLEDELVIDKNVTLDLGEYSITGDPGTNIVTVSNYDDEKVSVTITGGSIENTSSATDTYYKALVVSGNADVTLTNVDLTCTTTFYGYGLQLTTTEDGYAPTVTVGDGCNLDGGYCGVMIANTKTNNSESTTLIVEDGATITGALAISGNGTYDNTVIIVNGGTITSNYEDGTAIYHPQHGTLTINGGTLTGDNCVQMCDGEFYLNGGTLTANGTDIRADITSTSGNIPDGAAISLVHRGSGYAEEDNEPKLVMTGGTCVSTQAAALLAYGWTSNYEIDWDHKDLTITGGEFSDSSAREYIAEGYDLEYDVASGNWVVVKVDPFTVTDENGNPVVCDTLAEAIEAVADGGTIEMNEDTDLTEMLEIGKSVTLNLNNHTIYGTGGTSVLSASNDSDQKITVSIDGGTIECTTTATDKYYKAITFYGNTDVTLTNVTAICTDTFYGYGVQVGSSDQEYAPNLTVGEGCDLEGGYCGIMISSGGTDEYTTLTVEDGATIVGAFGISGNGTCDNTNITINGGTITSSHEEGCGIYNPQHGTLTINGGTITGPNGIEMCDGELIINNGYITGTSVDTRITDPTNSGNIVDGSAVSLLQRGGGYAAEDDEPKATIVGGTLISEQAAAFLAYGWKNAAEVDWDTKDITITGGTYSDESVKEYLSDDYTLVQDGDVYHVTQV